MADERGGCLRYTHDESVAEREIVGRFDAKARVCLFPPLDENKRMHHHVKKSYVVLGCMQRKFATVSNRTVYIHNMMVIKKGRNKNIYKNNKSIQNGKYVSS